MISGHVAATRGPSLVYGVYPEFEGLELSLWLAPYVFYPYYAVFACAAVYHAFNGAGVALGILGWPLPRLARQGLAFWVPVAASAVVAFVAILGIGGWLDPLPDPRGTEVGRLAARLLGRSLPWSD